MTIALVPCVNLLSILKGVILFFVLRAFGFVSVCGLGVGMFCFVCLDFLRR